MVPGSSARDIDLLIESGIRSRGGIPAFKGYKGADGIPFPASTCFSIDAEVVHGIPGDRVLESGQIVGLDIGVDLDGYFGDAARTYLIGDVSEDVKRLVTVTRESLDRGIAKARAGNRISDISHAVQNWAEGKGFSVVRELSGHGVGKREVVTGSDGWTVRTLDNLPSAHWEETIVVTDGDPLILTRA